MLSSKGNTMYGIYLVLKQYYIMQSVKHMYTSTMQYSLDSSIVHINVELLSKEIYISKFVWLLRMSCVVVNGRHTCPLSQIYLKCKL